MDDDAVATAMDAGRPDAAAIAAALRVVQARLFPAAPQRVGRYLLLDELGRGGMGVVFRGYDPELDRRVAVKLVPHRGDVAALKREAQALARLSHRNVVPVHDVGDTGGEHPDVYIVMELVEGVTLDAWLRDPTRTRSEVIASFVKAARGLAAAHAAGIIHRDFKPSNVVIDRDGEPRVLDFGIAAIDDGDRVAHTSVRGTLPFMSPELLRGESVDARTDQYALSVAMYRAIGGVFPFPADTPEASLAQKLRGAPTPMTRGCPPRLLAALLRGLRPDARERFDAVPAWIEAIEAATVRRRGRWLAAIAVAGTLATALVVDAGRDARRAACRTDAAAPAWTDATREGVRAEFVAQHGDTGRRSFDALDGDLVAMRDGITEARATLCEARIDATVTDALAQQRERCLDEVASEFAAFCGGIADAPALHVTGELLALPDAASCEQPPEGTDTGDDRTDVTATFGLVEAMIRSGRLTRAEAELAEQRAAIARASPSARARALLLEAKLWRHRGDSEHATALAFDALRLADDEAMPTHATHAMLRLVDALGVGANVDASRYAEAERWLALAQRRLDREGAPAWLVDFAAGERVDLLRAHPGPEAIAAAREQLALRRARLGERHLATATAHDGLGAALTEAGQLAEGGEELGRALAMRRDQLGEDHPSVARSLNNVAMNALLAGDAALAIDALTRALAIDVDRGEVGSPYWLRRAVNRVEAGVRGHIGEPIAWARELLAEVEGDDCSAIECVTVRLQLARLLIERGVPSAALAELGVALALLEALPVAAPQAHDADALLQLATHPGAPRRDDGI